MSEEIVITTSEIDVISGEVGESIEVTVVDGGFGAPGPAGPAGADGSVTRVGAGAPASGLGNVGDLYIDTATGNLYRKDA